MCKLPTYAYKNLVDKQKETSITTPTNTRIGVISIDLIILNCVNNCNLKEKQLVTDTEILWNLRKHRKIKMAKVWKNGKVRTENRETEQNKSEKQRAKRNLIYYYRNETKKRMWNKRKQSKLVIKTKQNRRVLILKITYENNTSIKYITLNKTKNTREQTKENEKTYEQKKTKKHKRKHGNKSKNSAKKFVNIVS